MSLVRALADDDLPALGESRADAHAFYTSLGFDRKAKQAFVISRPAPV